MKKTWQWTCTSILRRPSQLSCREKFWCREKGIFAQIQAEVVNKLGLLGSLEMGPKKTKTLYFASAHWPAERFGGNVNNGKLSSTVCSTTSLTTATSTLCHCSCYSITAIVAPLPPQTTIVPRGYFTEPCTSKKHGTSRKRHICSQEWCILQFYLPLS